MSGDFHSDRAQGGPSLRRGAPAFVEVGIAQRRRGRPADRVPIFTEYNHLVELCADDADARHIKRAAVVHVHVAHVDLLTRRAARIDPEHTGHECRRVSDLRMIPIEKIVDCDFPVAVDDELLDAGNHDHVAPRGNHIEAEPPGSAEKLFQGRCGNVVRPEYESLVGCHLCHLCQPVFRFVELIGIEGLESRHAEKLSVDAVGPPVIRAQEALGVAFLGATDGVTAMRAGVEHRFNRSILLPHHQHIVAAHY